jgi:hypothetical protein
MGGSSEGHHELSEKETRTVQAEGTGVVFEECKEDPCGQGSGHTGSSPSGK